MHGDGEDTGLRRRADDHRSIPAIVVILLLGGLLAGGLFALGQRSPPGTIVGAGADADPRAMQVAAVSGTRAKTSVTSPVDAVVVDAAVTAADGRLDPELARAMVLRLPGVVSVIWLDQQTLLARVGSADARSGESLRMICRALAELGDSGAVQVQVQNAFARSSAELEPLALGCGGEMAQVYRRPLPSTVPAAVREVYRQQAPIDALEARRRADAAMRVIRKRTPEML